MGHFLAQPFDTNSKVFDALIVESIVEHQVVSFKPHPNNPNPLPCPNALHSIAKDCKTPTGVLREALV